MRESNKNWIFYTLMFSNLIIYLAILALWISIPNELTLNLSVTFFNLCFSLLLIIKEKEPVVERVNRGGGWFDPADESPLWRRGNFYPTVRDGNLGFRLAQNL